MDYVNIENPAECCGCGACASVCPCGAVDLKEDGAGFIYPRVNVEKCVGCGMCIRVCVFTEKDRGANGDPDVYAAVTADKDVLMQSSSGGIFTELAESVIDRGGSVFGAAWVDGPSVAHIRVDAKDDLCKLRGSKYVQSVTGDAYKQAKELLDAGKPVCYSGTPCQIAGLKAFLGGDPDNLLTVDIICHGVPGMKILRDDLRHVSGGGKEIGEIKFRDKTYGWGTRGSIVVNGKKTKYNPGNSPYYFYFLKGEVYRESCYNCRFPAEGRQGDVTLGDYWGIKQDVVSRLKDVDPDKGISCVLVNTDKGRKWFEDIRTRISSAVSDRASAEKRNKQLTAPSVPLPDHQAMLDGYLNDGYSVFTSRHKKQYKDHLSRFIKELIPPSIKRRINDLRGK